MEKKLNRYIQESEKAISILSEQKGMEISSLDFQIALGEKFGYNRQKSHYVASKDLSAEQMVELLKSHSFTKPEEIGIVTFPDSIIPEGVPICLNEQEAKSKGEIWRIHKYDADPFPSNPHAHNKETGYKLHLGTGELFDNKNKSLNKSIRKKDLIALRSNLKNIALPTLEV